MSATKKTYLSPRHKAKNSRSFAFLSAVKKAHLLLFAAVVLLASCENNRFETKDQPGKVGQDIAVMTRDGSMTDAAAVGRRVKIAGHTKQRILTFFSPIYTE